MHTFSASPRLLGVVSFFVVLFVALAFLGRVPLKYNLRNLVVRWRVTVLTALEFTLVAALLTVMMAFVNGMFRLTANSAQPGNVVVLSDGATDELFSNLGFGDTSDLERDPPNIIHDPQHGPLASWELYLVVNQPVPPSSPVFKSHHRRFLQVRGIDDPIRSARVHGLEMSSGGQWFSGAGVRDDPSRSKEALQGLAVSTVGLLGSPLGAGPLPAACALLPGRVDKDLVIEGLLGEGIARSLGADAGKPILEVGDIFDLGPRRWIVSGILTTSGTTFDSEIWAKRGVVGPMFGKESSYTTLVLRTADEDKARETAEWVTKNFKKSAVQAQTETDYYEKLNETNNQFLYVFVIVMVFMAIGGVFGVMNTMFAAISQRIKDIGVLRILGFSRAQLLLSFFLETLLIAVIGGLIGLALGSLCHGRSMSSIAGGAQGGGKSVVFKLAVDLNICLGVMTFTLGMGIIGGLLPAMSALRLKALESLR